MNLEPRINPQHVPTAYDRFVRPVAARFLYGINHPFCRLFHQVQVLSPPQLPKTGPAILVCNHTSGLDPLMIQSACSRPIVWMMAAEYYKIRSLAWFFHMLEVIPVSRAGRDTASTRAALRALSVGRVLGVFPEGRIEKTPDLLPFQSGVALMAMRAEAPVYPAYLNGTQRGKTMLSAFLAPNRVTLSFGGPISFDRDTRSKSALEQATSAIQNAVEVLKQQSAKVVLT